MTWRIEFDPRAKKDLNRLAKADQIRILHFLYNRVATHPHPQELVKRLAGSDDAYSRFRVGDFRIIVKFHDARLTVLIIEIGHRREIYKR